MKLSSVCVGAILPAGVLQLVMSDQEYGGSRARPVGFPEPDFAWLTGSLQEPAYGVGSFPCWPALVAIRVLFSLAGGSNLHHGEHWSGRFWHGFLNTGSLVLFLFFSGF